MNSYNELLKFLDLIRCYSCKGKGYFELADDAAFNISCDHCNETGIDKHIRSEMILESLITIHDDQQV